MTISSVDPNTITTAPNQEPFTLVPVIEHVLRTRHCAPGTVFLVEGIDVIPVSKTGRWQAVRLLLGDGELCVQALLSAECHRLIETGAVSIGFYVRVDHFSLEWESVTPEDQADGRQPGQKMAFLCLHDLTAIGWNEAYLAMAKNERDASHEPTAEKRIAQCTKFGRMTTDSSQEPPEQTPPVSNSAAKPASDDGAASKKEPASSVYGDDFDMDDAFESMENTVPPSTTRKPKTAVAGPVALPRDWVDRRTPLKLTTLRAVPTLPYAQNWTCNVLAIVASLSPVESSYLPPYRQRTARLADPSTAKRVHLTVFLEPEAFCPAVGGAVLLTGVKNHRFDGGSLKKYASDGKDGQWWFEEPYDMGWCDVDGIKEWWKQVEAAS